jgi:2-methylcitrate dehydratase PrpD
LPDTIRKQLAEFIHASGFEDLTAEVILRAKHCLLDLIGGLLLAVLASGEVFIPSGIWD